MSHPEVFRAAILDVGTNSVLLTVAERADSGIRILYEDKEEPRLGGAFSQTGILNPAAEKRCLDSIARLLEKAHRFAPDRIKAVGTRILRDAPNAGEFVYAVEAKIGLNIETISGEAEARYAFDGALFGLGAERDSALVADIGGGSTEIAFVADESRLVLGSLPFGALPVTERYFTGIPAESQELKSAAAFIESQLGEKFPVRPAAGNAIFSGGTATTTAAALLDLTKYDPAAVHGSRFEFGEVVRFRDALAERTLAERRAILHLNPERADIIIGGLAILLSVLKCFNLRTMTVSNGGVRFGVMLEIFAENLGRRNTVD